MGEPTLAVDPSNPSSLIIASLHGAAGNGPPGFSCSDPAGPTPRSRCFLPFTTFTSTDAGASWQDNFYQAPDKVANAYGEHPAITIDPYGRVYVGSLYAQPGNGTFDYTIVAQKFSSLQTINQEQDGEYNAQFLKPIHVGNAIGQIWFLYNPATDNLTILWNEQVTPASVGKVSQPPICKEPKHHASPRPSGPSNNSSSTASSTTSSTSASATSSSTAPTPIAPG